MHHPSMDPTEALSSQLFPLYGRAGRELEEMFQGYGVRYATVEKVGELGFTGSTLAGMRDEELDDMMATLSHVFRWDLLVGERYGIKAAVRAERRRLEYYYDSTTNNNRRGAGSGGGGEHWNNHNHGNNNNNHLLDALSHEEGLSEEPVQQDKETAGSGGAQDHHKQKQHKTKKSKLAITDDDDDDEDDGGRSERQREHPFIVTEPGEVARGKKNGLDYLFHLYDQCREFLVQVQNIARERGEKCPTKVTNQVFRFAKKAGASYINKPKMRHYVHCYALHCLDEEASNALRRAFKERGENVGAWRQACYRPLVLISARHGWDIDIVFAANPLLSVWYVPTKLRQLCHVARSNAVVTNPSTTSLVDRPEGRGPHDLRSMFL